MKIQQIHMADYINVLITYFNSTPEHLHNNAKDKLFPKYLDIIEKYGLDIEKANPIDIVDRYLSFGIFVDRKSHFRKYSSTNQLFFKHKKKWNVFCEKEALIYDDDYACTSFGQ